MPAPSPDRRGQAGPDTPAQAPSAPHVAPQVGRAVGFIGKVVRQLKEEFAVAWEATAELPEEQTLPLKERLGRLSERVEDAERALAERRAVPGEQLRQLVDLAAGTEGMAQALRRDPALDRARIDQRRQALESGRAGATRPLGAHAPTHRRATGTLQAPSGPEARLAAARQPFDQAHQFASRALTFAEPRLSVVAMALEAIGPANAKRSWDQIKQRVTEIARQARLPASRMQWVASLASGLHKDAESARRAAVAVEQWRQAKALFAEAEQVRQALDGDPTQALKALEGFHAGKLRASVFPIGHLHLTFRGTAMLQDLFPPPTAQPASPTSRLGTQRA